MTTSEPYFFLFKKEIRMIWYVVHNILWEKTPMNFLANPIKEYKVLYTFFFPKAMGTIF